MLRNLSKKTLVEILGLVIIFLIGAAIYFYKLDKIPSGFYIDEALPGYNAYSIFLTGKDEYGKILPMFLRFYGSYNPPLFTYSVIPSIAILGLNVFAVRVPSALAGLLSGLVVFFLLKYSSFLKSKTSMFLGMFLFLISPWIVLHSRVGYEVSLAFFLFSLGCLFLWLGLKKPERIFFGLIFLSLSTYAAYAERFLVPMVIASYVFIFRKILLGKKFGGTLKKALVTFFVTQVPHLIFLSTPAFFPKGDLWGNGNNYELSQKIGIFLPSFLSTPLAFLREFSARYLTYFSPRSLFFLPDPDPQRSIPELSVFYPWMVVLYVFGIYIFWKRRRENFSKFIFILAIVAPIPAALSRDPFATHRALPLLLPLIVIMAAGVDLVIRNTSPKVWWILVCLVSAWSFVLLWRTYFILLPNERARYWGYGIGKLASQIKAAPEEHFLIDEARSKPLYINLAFFLKYPPEKFHREVDPSVKFTYYWDTKFNPHYKFANIETRAIEWEKDIYRKQILVGDELAISTQQAEEHFLIKVFEIKDPLGLILFQGYRTDPRAKCVAEKYTNPFCSDTSTF